jgi:hypothetical protein
MLWRRFLVRSDSTLADLHVVLQIGFDWTDFHLHRFRINERFLYEYDFGDLWQHQVRIEKRLEIETSRSYPVCVGGQWAGPPEDADPDLLSHRHRAGEEVRLDEFLRDIESHVDLRVLGLKRECTTNRRRMATPERTLVQVVGLSSVQSDFD